MRPEASGASPTLAERYHAARVDPQLAVLEGLHALKHALRFGARILEAWTPDPDELGRLASRLAPDVAGEIAALAAPLDHDLFRRLAPAPHPTGVIALARRAAWGADPARGARAALSAADAPVVLLERPTHHGNIGAVVRVAAAAGAGGVLVTGAHDPWHPASLRGGAGLQFALPVARVDALPETDRPLFALDPEGEPLVAQLPRRAVLAFGSERTGLSPALLKRATARVSIPMRPGVSSLNLATAVAVVLYAGLAR